MRIVVLQHSVTNQRIFQNVLGKCGFGPVATTADPFEARQRCAKEQPAVLIASKELIAGEEEVLWNDWKMPETGDRIAIIVTGYQFSRDETIRFIQKGADELLILPFQPEQLEEKLAAVRASASSSE